MRPAYGLLLDVDGPISNPDAKQIIEPRIIPALIDLLDQGVPVVFNTGRADAAVRRGVLSPLLKAGPERVDRLHALCEKGAVRLSVNEDHSITEEVNDAIAVPQAMWDAIKSLVNERFSSTMFFDEEERTMVSIERNLTTSHDEYSAAQVEFVNAAFDLLNDMGYGIELRDRVSVDANGNTPYRIDPTIIACDVEAVVVGKDLGAQRAYDLLKRDVALPEQWRTVGDSDTDYAMAQWLHDRGETVKHLDVRSSKKPSAAAAFEVLRPTTTSFDRAGGAYLAWLVAHLRGGKHLEERFDG